MTTWPTEMISVEQARSIVLAHTHPLPTSTVPTLQAVGRVVAAPCASDIDVAPFAHSAMDGFALRADQIKNATPEAPVNLSVIAEIGAGSVYEGACGKNECVRIMTGAELPSWADSVVKYEVVGVVEGDGKTGSVVSFTEPTKLGSNVRAAGEEAKAGDVVLHSGDILRPAGMGALASCGVTAVEVYDKPRVAIIATGSELVPPTEVPGPGHIRESNSYALAACVQEVGAIPFMLPIAEDSFEGLLEAVQEAANQYDFVITTGGAANGDFDYTKKVAATLGEVFMTQVNMRPGKAQTFALLRSDSGEQTPFFGLPGNPAAAYCGFQMLIRPALRKMQGYTAFEFPRLVATLTQLVTKKDKRRLYMRATYSPIAVNEHIYEVTPAKNQSSGLFGVIQRSNCMIVLPEGEGVYEPGTSVECLLMDLPEETVL